MEAPTIQQPQHVPWATRNRWRIGLACAALVGGYFWQRRARRRRVAVDRVSERWLAEREFTAGQHPEE